MANQWIDFLRQTPEDGQTIVIISLTGNVSLPQIIGFATYHAAKDGKQAEIYCHDPRQIQTQITHWFPIPNIPKILLGSATIN